MTLFNNFTPSIKSPQISGHRHKTSTQTTNLSNITKGFRGFLDADQQQAPKAYPPLDYQERCELSSKSSTGASDHKNLNSNITKPNPMATIAPSHPLGDLGYLPLELRLDVFNRLLPQSFRRVYRVTGDTLTFDPELSSPQPLFLHASKQLRLEMLQGLMVGGTCKIRIDIETVTTNFVETLSTIKDKSAFQLPICNVLELIIIPQFPRSAHGFNQLRQNLEAFVEALNNCSCDILPKVKVKLEHQSGGGGFQCDYNDFSMLMGPLSHLKKPCRGVMIYRTTGWYSFSAPIERQCELIEKAVAGCEISKKLLSYQQLMIQIKLPRALFDSRSPKLSRLDRNATRPVLDAPACMRVWRACLAMQQWCWYYAAAKPKWLNALTADVARKDTPSEALLENVFEGCSGMDMRFWAAGLMTRINPFWNEQMMSPLSE